MKPRTVRLLKPERELTPRQLAQRKYRRSAKGKAAQARAWAKWYGNLLNHLAHNAKADKYHKEIGVNWRVYQRIWIATKRRLQKERETTK